MNKLILRGFLNALGTSVYVAIVATIMSNGERIFGTMNKTMAPIAFLMLFILSATITSSLVLGKPVLMYLNNQKTEAVKLFLYTVCWLAVMTIGLFLLNLK